LQDVQATIDDKKAGKPSTTGGVHRKHVTPSDVEQRPSGAPADASDGDGPRTTELSGMTGPKLPSKPPQPAATSACMAKADLKEFVNAQRNAVAGVVALNPTQKNEASRPAYKWPTRTHGCQIGSSLTRLTDHAGDSTGDGRQKSCGSAFRLGRKQ